MLNWVCFIKKKKCIMNLERLASPSRALFCLNVDAGDAVPLGCAGASSGVSQLLCCCGNTNKICCFGLTQFRVINNNKNKLPALHDTILF